DQEVVDHAVSAIALALVGVEHAHQLRVQQHQPSHLYLCRGQLLPNPRIGTPWQALYDSHSDRTRSLRVIIQRRYGKKKNS
ncbi:hypothetical protein L208DRAFT_1412683, partial [Tricholoma matsutake]